MKKKRRIKPVFLIFFYPHRRHSSRFPRELVFCRKDPAGPHHQISFGTADASAHRGKDEADREITG